MDGGEFLLRQVDSGDDRGKIRDMEELLIDGDEISEVDHPLGDGTGNRGADAGVFQFTFGVGCAQPGLLKVVAGIDEDLFADQLLIPEAFLALVFPPGLFETAFCLFEGGLLDIILEAGEKCAAGDGVTFLDEKFHDAAGCLGENVDAAFGLEGRGEVEEGADCPGLQPGDLDGNGFLDFFPALFSALSKRSVAGDLEAASSRAQHEERDGDSGFQCFGHAGFSLPEDIRPPGREVAGKGFREFRAWSPEVAARTATALKTLQADRHPASGLGFAGEE